MYDDIEADPAAAHAMLPALLPSDEAAPRAWALVEIFGHRKHYGEIREVEAFGAKLLEVCDADTGQVHRYGGASIFSLTMLSQADWDKHVLSRQRDAARRAEYDAVIANQRLAGAAAGYEDDDNDRPF